MQGLSELGSKKGDGSKIFSSRLKLFYRLSL